jgi:hypothetical protein
MSTRWKPLDTENNSLTIDPLEDENLGVDGITRPKQVIYWTNFMSRSRKATGPSNML